MTKVIVIDDDGDSDEFENLEAAKADLDRKLMTGEISSEYLSDYRVIEATNEYKVTPRVRFELKESE